MIAMDRFQNRNLRFILWMSLIAALVSSCYNSTAGLTESDPNNSDAAIKYAQRFTLEKTDSSAILTVTDPWQGAKGIRQVYHLVGRDLETTGWKDTSAIIRVPVKSVICMSTTHVAMIAALGRIDAITGVSGAGFIYDPRVRERIGRGLIREVGYESGLNHELVLSIAPDIMIAYGIGSESAGYLGKLKELGVKVLFNADYLEKDPLAKAEWIKVFGALFSLEQPADSVFDSVCESYNQIKGFVQRHSAGKPDVLLGLPFRDTWFVSPGDSYPGRLIEDAGGKYLWYDTKSTVSMPLSLEEVFLRSLKADYWLNTGSAASKSEIASLDPRLQEIPCFNTGTIYNNNMRISPSGGNDYWESGIINPHIILKDVASILHPEMFPGYELFYYRKLE